MLESLKARARALKREVFVLIIAMRDARTPWHARILGSLVIAYACSPIDLIPDFIPVLGLLDDLILVPLGIALTLKLVPVVVLEDARVRAEELITAGKPVSRVAALVIVVVWLLVGAWLLTMVWGLFKK